MTIGTELLRDLVVIQWRTLLREQREHVFI
jgi:hypothetical protein